MMKKEISGAKFCRWCRQPTPISSQSTTGLCRSHWREYVGRLADINNSEESICPNCGGVKSKNARVCKHCVFPAKTISENYNSYANVCEVDGCTTFIRKKNETKCYYCRTGASRPRKKYEPPLTKAHHPDNSHLRIDSTFAIIDRVW